MVKLRRNQIIRPRQCRILIATFVIALSATYVLNWSPGWSAEEGSIARGGRLFDNWILESRDRPPAKIHPMYKIIGLNMRSVETSWRCVSCHGWDYKGRTDQGVGALGGNKGIDYHSLASIMEDENHRYGEKLSKRDLTDLAAFIARGRVDVSSYIDPDSNTAVGNAKRESALYATVCANCHGADGHRITTMLQLGTFARRYPREALHKILNGHPAERMPPLRFLKVDRLGDMLAYIQTLPAKNLLGSIARGGRLYDDWQKEIDAPPPTSRHPAYPKGATFAAIPVTNWRCKECHGWDYRGRDGVYGKGSHRTGIKGIRALAGGDPQVVVELLMDANHRYHGKQSTRAVLDLQDLMDLANFVTRGQIDMDAYIDRRTGAAKGRADRHRDVFDLLCVTCHGKRGDALSTGNTIGNVARDNPWEALHKIKNGHPGEAMPALLVFDIEMVIDILAYAQYLP